MATPYHHGDLRRALLDEAASVLEAQGVAALSLRDVARRVGVSPTAPYHHFQSKAELVRALADEALAGLEAALAEADAAHEEPVACLRAQGVAYVLFAVEHPERFRLAFRPELCDPFPELHGVPDDVLDELTAFRHLIRRVRTLVADPARQKALALAAWSLVHGLAALLVDGPLRDLAADRARVRALAETTVAHLALDPPDERHARQRGR